MSDDTFLKQAMLDELKWKTSMKDAHVGATAKARLVARVGHVLTFSERFPIAAAARPQNDVTAVALQGEARLRSNIKIGHGEIIAAVTEQLRWNAYPPSGVVRASAGNGWVVLTRQLDWRCQQTTAVSDVPRLCSASDVLNPATIKPSPDMAGFKDNILAAVVTSWLDPATINLTTDSGRVTLTGPGLSW